jgi:SNF family Na+-dependent transporter
MADPIGEASAGSHPSTVHSIWRFLLRFVVPLALIFILWNSLPETWAKVLGVLGFG